MKGVGKPFQQGLVEGVRGIEKPFYIFFRPQIPFFYFIPVHFHLEEALMDDKGKFFLVARFAAQKFPIKEIRIKGP